MKGISGQRQRLTLVSELIDAIQLQGLTTCPELHVKFLAEKLLEQLPTDEKDRNMLTKLTISYVPFTKASLTKILKLMGFQVDTVEEKPHYAVLNGTKTRMDISDFIVTLKGEEE